MGVSAGPADNGTGSWRTSRQQDRFLVDQPTTGQISFRSTLFFLLLIPSMLHTHMLPLLMYAIGSISKHFIATLDGLTCDQALCWIRSRVVKLMIDTYNGYR